MAKLSEFVTVSGAAKVWGVTQRQVLNLIGNGTLKAKKIGRESIIRRSDLAKCGKPKSDAKKPD